MKKNKINIFPDNRFMALARVFVALIMLFVMGILTAQSMLGTSSLRIINAPDAVDTAVFRIRESWESVSYLSDNILGNIIWLVCGFLIIALLLPLLKKIPIWVQIIFTSAVTITLGCIWVYSSNLAPTEDSGMVTYASWEASKNHLAFLQPENRYFHNYSYQLGYVLFNEVLIRVFEHFKPVENLLFLEVINVILLAVGYSAIIYINHLIFNDKRVTAVTSLLLMLSAQTLIFCSFLYGIIPGMCFAVLAVMFMVLYLKKDNFIFAPFSAVFLGLSVMIKQNNLIVLVAVCCILFVTMFRRKKFIRDILFIAASVGVCVAVNPAVSSFYEKRADLELGDAIPITSWVAMGLDEAGNAPGWYSGVHTVVLHADCQFDAELTNTRAKEVIKKRLKYFKENPQYCNEFFYRKFMSQWNETSYESIWNNQIRTNYFPRKKLAEWVCTKGELPVKRYMDCYAQLIFMAVFVGIIACLKNKNFLSITFPVIILGGMLYHLIAEAKSQYAVPYFILMMGFAGYGIVVAYDYFGRKTENKKILRWIFRSRADVIPVAVEGVADDVIDVENDTVEAIETAENEVTEIEEEATESDENSDTEKTE